MTEEQIQAEWAVLQEIKSTYHDAVGALMARRALVAPGSNPPQITLTYGALALSTTDTALIEQGRVALYDDYTAQLEMLLTAAQVYRQTPP